MLNLKKTATKLEVGELSLGTCPVCGAFVSHMYFMQDAATKVTSKWYSCSCGVVFQNKLPDGKETKPDSTFYQKIYDNYAYPVKVYSPVIEELIYGRKVLLVGQPNTYQEQEFESRGWVVLKTDDFEKQQFKESEKFNMIWLYMNLERFHDPIASLQLCHKLLAEDGILFIASPDTDFISTRSSSNFMHWKPNTNHIMWNRRSIARHLDHLGFNVILNRQNYEHRFSDWDTFHLVAQKKFF
jgi:predicted SAM-dependent methyltransferase/rubredoxin